VAERAAGLKCHVLAANRSPVADPAPAETVFPLADLDRMLREGSVRPSQEYPAMTTASAVRPGFSAPAAFYYPKPEE
jgi:hypothetical protein